MGLILSDPRHPNVWILSDPMTPRRVFSNWSILHVDLDGDDNRPLPEMTVGASRSSTLDEIDRLIHAPANPAVSEAIDAA